MPHYFPSLEKAELSIVGRPIIKEFPELSSVIIRNTFSLLVILHLKLKTIHIQKNLVHTFT